MDRPQLLHPARMLAQAGFFMLLTQPLRLPAAWLIQAATPTVAPPSPTALASATLSLSPTGTPTPSQSASSPATATPTTTTLVTAALTGTASLTPTSMMSPTASPPATPAPTNASPGAILINEVAWAGTSASPQDEWIELFNPGPASVDLSGWQLTDGGDITIQLAGSLAAYSFLLLERTDDSTVASLPAGQIYTGALANSGEALALLDGAGALVDTANQGGGAWPAGDADSRATMERLGGGDLPGNWVTFGGVPSATAADGSLISGSPLAPTSAFTTTATPTAPQSATASASLTPPEPGSVLINEVAWAGTFASASDEWIELLNTTGAAIDTDGWLLTDGGDVTIHLTGILPAHGFGLLERSDDSTVADVDAFHVFSGTLRNDGETLDLLAPGGVLIDRANGNGGGWPAGEAASRRTMERRDGGDGRASWGSFTGFHGNGIDSAGHPITGTPGQPNSLLFPTPTPTWIPGQLVINEVLIRPHYDWEGAGGVSTDDEFIEIYNRGPHPVWLRGWLLDDVSGGGSRPYALPGITIDPGDMIAFFRSRTHIALNDSGDSVRLLAPNGRLIDKIHYLAVRAYNLSYGRLPDGSNAFAYGLWPTPNDPNVLFVEPGQVDRHPLARPAFACAEGERIRPALPRLARPPSFARWLWWLGLGWCESAG